MKTSLLIWIALCSTALAATEEQLNRHFTVQTGGKMIVDVDVGSIKVSTSETTEVVVDVWRKVSRKNNAAEDEYLKANPVEFEQNGSTVSIRCHEKTKANWSWKGGNRNEAKYTITVPSQFNVGLKTAGGGIEVSDLTGEVKARTSGGGLHFARLHGPLDGNTSGGGIGMADCHGDLKIGTSGGGIDVSGGRGTLTGHTSGGSVSVRNFQGTARVGTSGGGITVENVSGDIEGSTSGGSIQAVLASPVGKVRLSTSGGGLVVKVPSNAAFDLDAQTSAGTVSSDLPVTVVGKLEHSRLKGAVNGGGNSVVLRSSAGGIHVKNL